MKRAKRADGEGYLDKDGRWVYQVNGRLVFGHVLKAEKALGKRMPKGVVIHHFDENPSNNDNDNLVICPDRRYHALLHTRTNALKACGYANWEKCTYCKQYSPPEQIRIDTSGSKFHLACDNKCSKEYYQRRKKRNAPAA